MRYRTIFTRKDILVVTGCVVFLLVNLGAVGSSGRRRAKEMVCVSNLRKWGVIFQMFTNNNNGYFSSGLVNGAGWSRGGWIIDLRSYIEPNANLLRCPEATKRDPKYEWGGTFNTYYIPLSGTASNGGREEPSYGANCWIYNPPPDFESLQGRPTEWNWRTPKIKGAKHIPVFADTMYRGGGPYEYGVQGDPPDSDGLWLGYRREMMHFCINRHNGAVNHLFMDWSVRKVGLKELWTLKWHRQFDTNGPWTTAGGVQPSDWPEWMRNFKDY